MSAGSGPERRPRRWPGVELTQRSLNQAARRAFEALMQDFPYKTELARRYFAGVKQARQEGRQEGTQEAVLEVLAARGLRVDAKTRKRILTCTEPEQLQRWLRKAAVAESLSELFEPEPTSRTLPRKADLGRSARARKPSAQ